MEDRYGLSRQHSGIWKSLRDGDFEEEDVWDVLKGNNNNSRADYYGPIGGGALKIKGKESFPIPSPRPILPTASRMIPRPNSTNNISASSSHESKVFQQSAPVNIPDWSKIYNRNNNNNNSKNKPHKNNNVSRFDDYNLYHSVEYDDDDADAGYGDHVNNNYDGGDSDDDEDLEDDDEYDPNKWLPPHEFIARRLARSQISSFSVLEGVGRTLKGRDLSKVRNAVLTKTGFLESL